MLERMDSMPTGTIGLAAEGAVTATGCERTLLPPVVGWSASDVAWLRKVVRLLAPFMRGEMRLFRDVEIEQAKTRVASRPRGPTLACSSRSRSR